MKKLILSLVLISQVAFAAKFKKMEKASDYQFTAKIMKEICEGVELDCYVNIYKIVSKNPQEKWEQTIKQIIHSGGYVEEAYAEKVTYTKINQAVNDLLESANIEDDKNDKLDLLAERLENDLSDSSISLYAGGYSGVFSLSHNFLALIDKRNNEIIFIGAGYSE
jgi:hypothetical protein